MYYAVLFFQQKWWISQQAMFDCRRVAKSDLSRTNAKSRIWPSKVDFNVETWRSDADLTHNIWDICQEMGYTQVLEVFNGRTSCITSKLGFNQYWKCEHRERMRIQWRFKPQTSVFFWGYHVRRSAHNQVVDEQVGYNWYILLDLPH